MAPQLTLSEFHQKTSLSKEELIAISYGRLVTDAPETFIRIPAPPMLMLDRVTAIERNGAKGKIVAERDVRVDDWFFGSHFIGDPVQPGCLGVDAIWQLIGLYLGLCGVVHSGRALGCKEVEFNGQIRPHNTLVTYEVIIRRMTFLPAQGAALAIGEGRVYVDGEQIYTVRDAKVGGFENIAYGDYPFPTDRSRGGLMSR